MRNAIFNFRVLRALNQVAETGVPVEVKHVALKQDLLACENLRDGHLLL